MKHTIKVSSAMSFVIENKATAVRVEVVTPLFSKDIDLTHHQAGALAAGLVIAAEAVERNMAGVDYQRLVNNAEGLVK